MSTSPPGLRRPIPLLSSMATDLHDCGTFRAGTAAVMWAAYATHTAFTGWALGTRAAPLPVPARTARTAGAGLLAVGVALCVAGMSRFSGPRELSGTRNEELLTTGIYRYSRNPQYLGYLVALTGAAVFRRSGLALALTAALSAAYDEWVPVEEHHLAGLYGQGYLDYASRTHRWWGTADLHP